MAEDIGYYLPHKEPMLLLDKLVDVDEENCSCNVWVDEQSAVKYFIENNHLDCTFFIELMAQCIGVWSGYHQRQAGATSIKKGMLIGIRNAKFYENKSHIGKLLEVTSKAVLVENNLGNFYCKILSDGCIVASATITTYQLDDGAMI